MKKENIQMLLQLKEQIENDTKKYDELRKEIEEEM